MPFSLILIVIALVGIGTLITGIVKKSKPAIISGIVLVVIATGLFYFLGVALQNM